MHITFLDASYASIYADIHGQCFPKKWDEATFRQLLLMPNAFGCVCFEQDLPVAFMLCSIAADEAEIISICAVPDYRRKGLSGLLLQTVLEHLKTKKIKSLFLEVAVDNDPAIAFYKTSGFIEVGVRKNYYDNKTDALIMKKDNKPDV